MSSLVEDDLTRAATFFTLAFGLTAVGGLALGDPRLGVEYGVGLGAAFAVFAYFFVAPTADDEGEAESGPAADAEEPPADSDGE